MKLVAGCKSHIGNTRKTNQDAVTLKAFEHKGQNFLVLAVCDGVGGLEHGEIASGLAVSRVSEWFDYITEWFDVEKTEEGLLISHLKDLTEECNTLVREYRFAKGMKMGTTLSLLMILRDTYYIIQVGDSRIYRYRAEQLEQLTVDASVTKARDGRMKSYLDNYLGKQDDLWFTSASGKINKGDIYIVCSDGFYHQLTQQDIQEYEKKLHKSRKTEEACDELIGRMMSRGEHDNITVGVITVD